jgi:hypothetical protein
MATGGFPALEKAEATISTAGGAFFGGVGAQAGQMAADMIFQNPSGGATPAY